MENKKLNENAFVSLASSCIPFSLSLPLLPPPFCFLARGMGGVGMISLTVEKISLFSRGNFHYFRPSLLISWVAHDTSADFSRELWSGSVVMMA